MKTKVLSRFLYLLLAMLLGSFTDPYTIKRISDKDFRYEFYTTDKIVKPKADKMYYWFKGGLIHNAQGGMAGALLDGKYIKMYHSNQLAEQGEFKNGIKVGLWTTWHPNGIIASTQKWKNGLRSGKYFRYNENGVLVENGKFRSDLKVGQWSNTESKEIITYRKGIIVKKKENFTKFEKYKKKKEGIQLEKTEKSQKELEITSDALKLAEYKAKEKEEQKIAREKAKKDKEAAVLVKRTAKEEAKKETKKASKSELKGDSKIKTFFKNIFGKKQ